MWKRKLQISRVIYQFPPFASWAHGTYTSEGEHYEIAFHGGLLETQNETVAKFLVLTLVIPHTVPAMYPCMQTQVTGSSGYTPAMLATLDFDGTLVRPEPSLGG